MYKANGNNNNVSNDDVGSHPNQMNVAVAMKGVGTIHIIIFFAPSTPYITGKVCIPYILSPSMSGMSLLV